MSPRPLEEALKRLAAGEIRPEDIIELRQALSSGQVVLASGGSIAIGGNVVGSTITATFVLPPEVIKLLTPHEIPPPPLDFVGREAELRDLLENFERVAIIVGIRGLGGIGKTVLAYKLAEELIDRYPDGQLMVNLQGTSVNPLKPAEAMTQIIRAYYPGIELPKRESELPGLYQSTLYGKRVFLLLDNAEDDQQVQLLLPSATCGVLITSRSKFTLPGIITKDLDTLAPSDASDLLLGIANRIGEHAYELAKLCGFLPLALRATGSLLANMEDIDPAEYVEELRAEHTRLEHIG